MTRLGKRPSRDSDEFSMPHAKVSGYGLDARRRRVKFRAWHRGMLEMDLVMGRFVDAEIARLDEAEVDDLERLLDAEDREVLGWVTGEIATPEAYDTEVLRKIRAFHTDNGALRG